jgi:hypothetical protein
MPLPMIVGSPTDRFQHLGGEWCEVSVGLGLLDGNDLICQEPQILQICDAEAGDSYLTQTGRSHVSFPLAESRLRP